SDLPFFVASGRRIAAFVARDGRIHVKCMLVEECRKAGLLPELGMALSTLAEALEQEHFAISERDWPLHLRKLVGLNESEAGCGLTPRQASRLADRPQGVLLRDLRPLCIPFAEPRL